MKRVLHFFVSALIAAGVAAPGHSQSVAGTIDLRFELTSGCTIGKRAVGSMPDAEEGALLDFGEVLDPAHPIDGRAISARSGAVLNIACSSDHVGANAPTLSISGGDHLFGTQRRMAGPRGALASYDLFRDPARSEPYTPGIPIQIGLPTAGLTVPIEIYGRVPNVSALPDGVYNDTVIVIIGY